MDLDRQHNWRIHYWLVVERQWRAGKIPRPNVPDGSKFRLDLFNAPAGSSAGAWKMSDLRYGPDTFGQRLGQQPTC